MKQVNKMTIEECKCELITNQAVGCEGLIELVELGDGEWCATVELSDLDAYGDTEIEAIRNAVRVCRELGKVREKHL